MTVALRGESTMTANQAQSSNRDDERDRVISRFVVVRRERLVARWL
jgi:hypothetical protein